MHKALRKSKLKDHFFGKYGLNIFDILLYKL